MKRCLMIVALFVATTAGTGRADTLKPGTFACRGEMDALSVHRMMKVDDLTAATKQMQALQKKGECRFFDDGATAYVEGASFLEGDLKWIRIRGETDHWWVSGDRLE